MKEIRFSVQCGASNRKSLMSRRCSQCISEHDHVDVAVTNALTVASRIHSGSHRSLSSASVNVPANFLSAHRRTTITDRPSDSDKFDTLLMVAAERAAQRDRRSKSVGRLSTAKKPIPLLLIEQDTTNHNEANLRASQVRFLSTPGYFDFEFVSLSKQ